MIVELIVGTEALALAASWIRRSHMKRQQTLFGDTTPEVYLPFLDAYIKRQMIHPTRFQTFASRKIAAVCRRVVYTGAFELLILKLIQSASHRSRQEAEKTKVEVIL